MNEIKLIRLRSTSGVGSPPGVVLLFRLPADTEMMGESKNITAISIDLNTLSTNKMSAIPTFQMELTRDAPLHLLS